MTTKRKTKAQREAEQKAALYQRVHDVYCGAMGQAWDADDFATAEIMASVVPALRSIFKDQDASADYLWDGYCLKYFDNPKTAATHLFEAGIRA